MYKWIFRFPDKWWIQHKSIWTGNFFCRKFDLAPSIAMNIERVLPLYTFHFARLQCEASGIRTERVWKHYYSYFSHVLSTPCINHTAILLLQTRVRHKMNRRDVLPCQSQSQSQRNWRTFFVLIRYVTALFFFFFFMQKNLPVLITE